MWYNFLIGSKGEVLYETENTSGSGLFDHHHCAAPAVLRRGDGLKLLSGPGVPEGVRADGADRFVFRKLPPGIQSSDQSGTTGYPGGD